MMLRFDFPCNMIMWIKDFDINDLRLKNAMRRKIRFDFPCNMTMWIKDFDINDLR